MYARWSEMQDVPTGRQDLESFTRALQRRGLILIATSSSGVKISLALSMTLQVAKIREQGVGLFSLAMNKHYIMHQLLAMQTGLDVHRLRDGWLTDDERTLVMVTAKTLSLAQVWIDDTSDLSVMQLRERAQQLVERHQIALIMVDHLHLLRTSGHGEGLEDRLQELSEIHHRLKEVADELSIPVVVFVPLATILARRHAKRYRPSQPSQDPSEKAFDHALFLYHDQLSAPEAESRPLVIGRMVITTHRHGLVTEVEITLQRRSVRSRDLEQGDEAAS